MGCCSSNYTTTAADANTTIDGLQFRRIRKTATKRSYSSRLSSASSGVFSRSTTPTRSSLHSRCNSPTSTTSSTPKPKPNNYKLQNCRLPKDMEMLSICDDFCEGFKLQQQQQQQLDTSFGYFTESISTGSTGSSSPTSSSKSALRYTRDTSYERAPSPTSTTSCGNLVMEMYMMTHSQGLMAKTSSPKPQRRCSSDNTYDVTAAMQEQSASYNKWSNYLQSTPAYMVHNLTNIPEAIAGHFCPSNFPAFIELVDSDAETSAAKRFKFADDATNEIEVEIDVHAADFIGQTNTISTEL